MTSAPRERLANQRRAPPDDGAVRGRRATIMCLGIPGEIVALREELGVTVGKVLFGGITRDVCLSCIPDAAVGEWVLVHVGFAIARVDREEAARAYQTLEELGLLSELSDDLPPIPPPPPPDGFVP